ncbi:MAG: ATP-binding protein, partial [Clostridia bacterium]
HSRYTEYELQMHQGDRIFLYTDGVPEATNTDNELYGTDRMIYTLNLHKECACEELLAAIQQDVNDFAGQAPQFDDITMLCLTLMPADTFGMQKLKLPPSLEAMEKVTAFVEQRMEEAGVPMKIVAQMNIAVDEIFSNIARYSGATDATVGVKVSNGSLTLRFADNGLPYDPTETALPDTTLSAEERGIGGLGLLMVRKFMDTVEYDYHDGLNILTL